MNDAIPGIMPGPVEVEATPPPPSVPFMPTQRDLDMLWRRYRLLRNGAIMPRITSRYARTVLLKNWLEGK